MTHLCKLCDQPMIPDPSDNLNRRWRLACPQCPEYLINLSRADSQEIYTEVIKVGNMQLVKYYVVSQGNISVYRWTNERWEVMTNMGPEIELTPKLARHWLHKLKTYRTFQ